MQRKKTREELLTAPYLSKTDICTLYGVPWAVAVRVFALAKEADAEALGDRIVYPTKVRLTSTLAVQGLTLATLQRQIKGAL